LKIGILAVQGDFEAHAAMVARLGAETVSLDSSSSPTSHQQLTSLFPTYNLKLNT